MTAYRVIDDHSELENSGAVPHSTLDSYANTSPYLLVKGVTGAAPPSARFLKAGTGVILADGGAGNDLTITVTGTTTSTVSRTTWMETPAGVVDGANSSFTLAYVPDPPMSLMLHKNGVLLKQDTDYTLTSAAVLFVDPPEANSIIRATYTFQIPFSALSGFTSWMETPSGVVDGTNDTFSLQYTPSNYNSLRVFVNGTLQKPGAGNDYTTSTNVITFVVPPLTDSNLLASYNYNVTYPEVGANTKWQDFPPEEADGSNSVFTLANTPYSTTSLMFYVNGILQNQGASGDYTLSGNVVTMTFTPISGSNIVATYPYNV